MIFVLFDLTLSFKECIDLYNEIKDEVFQYLYEIYGPVSIHKNGTRRKRYFIGRRKVDVRLQRFIINNTSFIDLYPLVSYPGSCIPFVDFIGNKDYLHNKKLSLFEEWCARNHIDCLSTKGFMICKTFKNAILYKSEEKLKSYTLFRKNNIEKKELNFIYLIQPILSA